MDKPDVAALTDEPVAWHIHNMNSGECRVSLVKGNWPLPWYETPLYAGRASLPVEPDVAALIAELLAQPEGTHVAEFKELRDPLRLKAAAALQSEHDRAERMVGYQDEAVADRNHCLQRAETAEARVAELEHQCTSRIEGMRVWRNRAETAEARVAELEAGLRLLLAQQLVDVKAERDALRSARQELQNIANADPREWGETADQFQQWAQNRARHTLAAIDAAIAARKP